MMVDFEEIGKIDKDFSILDKNVFDVEINQKLLYEIVRWQSANRRLGTHKTKGVSDIKATTRKPYKQKGTGRARQGSLCSPQFRGGAVIFGPVVRDHSFSLNKKVRKLGVKMAISEKIRLGKLLIVSDEHLSDFEKLGILDINKKISILAVLSKGRIKMNNKKYYVDSLLFSALNVHSVIRYDYILLTKSAAEHLNKRFA